MASFLNPKNLILKSLVVLTTIGFFHSVAEAATPAWTQQPAWATPPERRNVRNYIPREEPKKNPFEPGTHNLAVELGQVFLFGNVLGERNNSLGSQLHYTYGVSDIFGFDASLGYSYHTDRHNSGMSSSLLSFLSGLRTNLNYYDRIVPFARFGLGFYRPSVAVTPEKSVAPFLFGLHLGAGVDLQITQNLFFGVSLNFHDIFGTTEFVDTGAPEKTKVEIGGAYTSFLLQAGVSF